MSEGSKRPRLEDIGTTVRQPGEPVGHRFFEYPSTSKAEAHELFKELAAANEKALDNAARINPIVYKRI